MLWVGTYNGLNRYDPATGIFKSFTIRDGLISDTILGIVIDNAGFIWISTGNGLSQFDPQSERFLNFILIVMDCRAVNLPVVRVEKEVMWAIYFGGMDGYNFFYPTS
jgi:ligand-binding sensor domain-containing protein